MLILCACDFLLCRVLKLVCCHAWTVTVSVHDSRPSMNSTGDISEEEQLFTYNSKVYIIAMAVYSIDIIMLSAAVCAVVPTMLITTDAVKGKWQF